mgnify:CR=1 FL=1
MPERHIIGLGGGGRTTSEQALLDDYVLSFARGKKALYLPTAVGDRADAIVAFHDRLGGRLQCSHLRLFPWPPENLREFVLGQDIVFVSGGNTANLLALWRVHGLDKILREAWEAGIVLTGGSAGMICWFEAGVTDSFGPQLEGMRDGLGFLPGSACPHYDGEARRRPTYRRLVTEGGFPPGIAADDGVALHYTGTALTEAVSCRDGASAYAMDRAGERPVPTRWLGPSS